MVFGLFMIMLTIIAGRKVCSNSKILSMAKPAKDVVQRLYGVVKAILLKYLHDHYEQI